MRHSAGRVGFVALASGFCLLGVSARGGDAPPAREALRYDGKPFEYWLGNLRTELKAERRVDTVRAMAAFGTRGYATPAAEAIAGLVSEYEDNEYFPYLEPPNRTPDETVLAEAVAAAQKIGAPAFEVFLRHADRPNVRTLARGAFYEGRGEDRGWRVIPRSEAAVQALVNASRGRDAAVREFAVDILGAGMDRDKQFREAAVAALLAGKPADRSLRSLMQELEHPEASTRLTAAWWLGRVGRPAKPAVGALLARLDDPAGDVRMAVLHALGLIAVEPDETVPALARILGDGLRPWDQRCAAAEALAAFGPQAGSAVPALLRAAQSEPEEFNVRASAILALKAAGAEPRRVVPCLVRLIQSAMDADLGVSPTWYLRVEPLLAYLADLGPDAKQALPVLLRAFQKYVDENAVRPHIADALGKMGPDARAALPALREALMARDERTRLAAAAAIEKITGGKKASGAEPPRGK